MKVKKVYQDNKGNWHIDYGFTHLMGLAIRVYIGGFFLWLTLFVSLLILSALVGFTFSKSLPEENTKIPLHFEIFNKSLLVISSNATKCQLQRTHTYSSSNSSSSSYYGGGYSSGSGFSGGSSGGGFGGGSSGGGGAGGSW